MRKAILVSTELRLINEFTQICAVTGLPLVVVTHVPESTADAIYFIDTSCLDANLEVDNVHVVCVGQPTSQVWLLAGRVNAESILTLPHDRSSLIELLTPTATTAGQVIGVTQTLGGSGTSTLASAIAHQLKNLGHTCALLEVSATYTAFEIALGDQSNEPIYVSQLIANSQFGIEGLNEADGLRFIANDKSHMIEDWLKLITYLSGQCEYVVLDISAAMQNVEILQLCNNVVVSLTNTIRNTAATRILLDTLANNEIAHGLAIRTLGGTSLNSMAIAEKLQTPLWAVLPTDNRIIEQIECGFGISMIRLASYTRAIGQLAVRLEHSDYVRSA